MKESTVLEIKSKCLKDFDLKIEDLITDPIKFKTEVGQLEECEKKYFYLKLN